MSMCPICNDTGWQTIQFQNCAMNIPCPLCTLGEDKDYDKDRFWGTGEGDIVSDIAEDVKGQMAKKEPHKGSKWVKYMRPRIKTTYIPDAGIDDEDDMPCALEIDDDLTNTVADDLPALMKEVERKLNG